MHEQLTPLNAPDDPLLAAFMKDQIILTAKISALVAGIASVTMATGQFSLGLLGMLFVAKWWSELYATRKRIANGRFGDGEDDHDRLNCFLAAHAGRRVDGILLD